MRGGRKTRTFVCFVLALAGWPHHVLKMRQSDDADSHGRPAWTALRDPQLRRWAIQNGKLHRDYQFSSFVERLRS